LEFFETENWLFSVDYTSPGAFLRENTEWYNYSVTQASEIIFTFAVDPSKYQTQLSDFSGTSTVNWGDNLIYSVIFSSTQDGGSLWETIETGAEVTCDLYLWGSGGTSTLQYSTTMTHTTNGIYTVSINSNQFSAGEELKYFIEITGLKKGYMAPSGVYMPVTINTIATNWSLHNSDNVAQTITGISQNYGEKVKATVSYHLNSNPSSRLSGATLIYSWDYGSGSVGEDSLNPTYYTFEIDTSSAPNAGAFKVDISISLLNHTTQSFSIYMQVLERTTTLNGSTTLLHISKRVYLGDAYNFTFEYTDVLSATRIGNLDTIAYFWYEIYANGSQKGATSDNLYLDPMGNNLYNLDFDTEMKTIDSGNSIRYAMFVTLRKDNYEQRMCFIDLTIEKRPITTDSDSFLLSEVQGTDIAFLLTLTDPTDNSALLTGATVRLLLGGMYYNFTEVYAGIYVLSFRTTDYNTFLMPSTLTGTVYIEKNGYQETIVPITMVVGMPEIFGIPTFYLLMIVGAIVAVAVSLVSYRVVQQRRIPTFVKKTKAAQKAIESKTKIGESLIYPTKDEYTVKLLGERWTSIGLSLEDILGVQRKKGKEAPSSDIKSKDIGGGGT
jgi:hypothetical protein